MIYLLFKSADVVVVIVVFVAVVVAVIVAVAVTFSVDLIRYLIGSTILVLFVYIIIAWSNNCLFNSSVTFFYFKYLYY